jgi:2'-5' RNA ligase/mRNA-degrading endonuclease RelE of RelBE toxin-antitoxin system
VGADQAGAGPVGQRQVSFHPSAKKELLKLDGDSRKRVASTINALQRGDEGLQTHALTQPLKGWNSTKASRGHRVIHRDLDDGTLHIGYVGLHDYDKAINRLSGLTDFFRQASLPQEWYHGSGAAFDRFDLNKNKTVQGDEDAKHWNSHLGAHFSSDHRVAQEFAQRQGGGHVYHAHLSLQNPKHYDSEHDLDQEAVLWAHHNGHDMGPSVSKPAYRANIEPDEWQFFPKYDDHGDPRPNTREIAHGFRDHLKAQGHDGITYGNEFEGAHNGFHAGERHLSAIAFHPDQITITQQHRGSEPHTATAHFREPEHTATLQLTEAEEGLLQRQAAAVANDDGVMVAFVPPREVAEQLALDGGQLVDALHITLAYLGNVSDYTKEQLTLLPQLVSAWAMRQKAVTIHIGGVGTFNNSHKDQHVLWAHPDIPGGVQMHVSLADYLERYGYRLPSEHGWTAHMTLQYVDRHKRFMPQVPAVGWEATEVVTFVGAARHAARLGLRPSTPTKL